MGGRKVQGGGDICILRANSLPCTAETITESRLTQFTITGQAKESERGRLRARTDFSWGAS